MSEFTDWIEEQRKERGWSQNELARRSGVTSPAMSHLMSGATAPGLKICNGLARAFEVPETFVLKLAGRAGVGEETLDKNQIGEVERQIVKQLEGMSEQFKITVLKTVRAWRLYVENTETDHDRPR